MIALDSALKVLYPNAYLRLESIREHKHLWKSTADDPDGRTEVMGQRRAIVITLYVEEQGPTV